MTPAAASSSAVAPRDDKRGMTLSGLSSTLSSWGGVLRRRTGSAVGLLALASGLIVLLLIHRRIYADIDSSENFQVDFAKLAGGVKPPWVGPGLEQSITGPLPPLGKMSLFDPRLVDTVVAYYERHPWVARVRRVEKKFPNGLTVELDLRRPVAAVYRQGGYFLVDREGVRLPGDFDRVPQLPFFVAPVVGVSSDPPLAGRRWEDPALQAAVRVADALVQEGVPRQLAVRAIDVTNVGGRVNRRQSEIVVWAEDHVAIEWGRAGDPARPEGGLERTAADKLHNLELVLVASPRLQGLQTVRVQFDRPYVALRTRR